MDSSANIEGLVLFIIIVLVLFMLGGTLCWAGLWRWRKGMDKATVDLEQLETLLQQEERGGRSGGRTKRSGGGKSKSKSKSEGKPKSKSKSKSGRKKSALQSEWDVESNGAGTGGQAARPQSEWDVQRQSSRPQSEWDVKRQSSRPQSEWDKGQGPSMMQSDGASTADSGSALTEESAVV